MKKRMKGILAMIAAGILAVAAIPISSCDEDTGIIEMEGYDSINLMYWCDLELREDTNFPYQIHFNPNSIAYQYECTTENGYLYNNDDISLEQAQKKITATYDKIIYWLPSNTQMLNSQAEKTAIKSDYIEIIMKDFNGDIVAYAVIKVRITQGGYYYGYILKSSDLYVEGINNFDRSTITEQQVKELIKKAKKL